MIDIYVLVDAIRDCIASLNAARRNGSATPRMVEIKRLWAEYNLGLLRIVSSNEGLINSVAAEIRKTFDKEN